jgi:hypothetical protein
MNKDVMKNYKLNIDDILLDPNLKVLYDNGFIDEVAVRNYIINSEFKQLRKTHPQIESIFLLSQKYNLAYGTINSIIFRKRSRKSLQIDKILKGFNQP